MKNGVQALNGRTFRYNRAHSIVEEVTKAMPEMLADNTEWQTKFGKNLWDIGPDGYIVLNSVGLSAAHWDDREARIEYLTEWSGELDEEDAFLVSEAEKEFC